MATTNLSTTFVSLLLLFFFTTTSSVEYLKLPLLHKDTFPKTPSHSLSYDLNRLNNLYSSLHRHRSNVTLLNRSAKLPLTSGASTGSGQYFVHLKLGTPPQSLLLVADTGSDLVWVTCSACRNCTSRPINSAFLPRHSTSFLPYHCYHKKCKLVPRPNNTGACNHTRLHSPCRYDYSYSDGSETRGFFATEMTTLNASSGSPVKFKKFAFGCSFEKSGPSITGPSFNGAQGVMGLGRGSISLASQLGRRFGNRFSYCLMDYTLSPTPTSYLLIGRSRPVNGSKMNYTPMINNPFTSTFYYIGIESVYIEDVKLRISPSVWAIDELGNGGTVMDSGTTLTFLAEPAYRSIVAAFKRLVKLPEANEPTVGFDLCVNVSGEARPSFPKMSFRLSGNSVLAPPPRNYFIDTAEDVKCLALQPLTVSSGFSVIGNLMQQGFGFEFDRDRSRIGFTRHGCGEP